MAAVDTVRRMEIAVRSTTRLQSGPDTQLLEAAQWAKEAGEALQIRLSPTFYKPSARSYQSWRDTSWTIEIVQPDEAPEIKDALEAFFGALATGGVRELTEVLQGFKAGRQL